MLALLQTVNVGLRFLLEIGALMALGYWGFQTESDVLIKIVLGLGAPGLAALLWMTFGAPAAARLVSEPWHVMLEVVIFGSAALALAAAEQRSLAIGFAVVPVINRVLMAIWQQ